MNPPMSRRTRSGDVRNEASSSFRQSEARNSNQRKTDAAGKPHESLRPCYCHFYVPRTTEKAPRLSCAAVLWNLKWEPRVGPHSRLSLFVIPQTAIGRLTAVTGESRRNAARPLGLGDSSNPRRRSRQTDRTFLFRVAVDRRPDVATPIKRASRREEQTGESIPYKSTFPTDGFAAFSRGQKKLANSARAFGGSLGRFVPTVQRYACDA
ncbi:hypothetical protein EYF80_025154 [Liparis tanakae]|uniref:Uncharacterized protein n=1 Tax=Liparis tanakae TaxID=230148 RepID=A0A4Z2HHA3_9TELE|nr:hypothetical protein EYF80_025154 [Liparis tanakae]